MTDLSARPGAEADSSADAPDERRPAPRRHPIRRLLIAGLVVLALLVAYVGVTFAQVWQASRSDGIRRAEAIVVLGAAQYDGRPSPVLANRLDHALALYEAGMAPQIVVTGGRQVGDRFTEATSGYNYLRERGVPDAAILKEVKGTTTWESLSAVARFLRTEGITDVVLVSSPAHAKRLAGIADDVGLDASVSPAEGNPSAAALLRETAAVAVGRLVGYRRLNRLDH